MKKFLLLMVAVLFLSGSVMAQDWKDLLKKAATEVADQATKGKLTEKALLGDWNYAAPGVKLSSDGFAAQLAGKAIERGAQKRLEKVYAKVGLTRGAGMLTLDKEGNFTGKTKEYTLKGKYNYDAAQHKISFTVITKHKQYEPISGYAYIDGEQLIVVFPITPLVDAVSKVGSRYESFKTIANILKNYEDIYVGFAFDRVAK